MPKDAPPPIQLPEEAWNQPEILDVCRAQDADALFRLAKKYGHPNETISYWTGIDSTEISKRINGTGTKGPVRTLDRWHRIADGLNMPDHARMELGIAPRRAPVDDPSAASTGSSPQIAHPVDGKLMTLVRGGAFLMGPDNEPVTLGAFYLDTTAVTNREYARFVHATGRPAPEHWIGGMYASDVRDHPVVHVSHIDARDYARWAGKRLPSEPEWEKAARGPKGNLYPWGNRPAMAKCNVRESGIDSTTPVGRYRSGVSPYGVYDLCGNVWEWCGTSTTADRYVLKGGAFSSPFSVVLPSATNDAAQTMQDDDTGFRCACGEDAINALFAN